MNYPKYNDYELIYMVRENDESAKNILFDKYMPIVKKIASEYYQNYRQYGYEYDDFLQEGLISFNKALTAYSDERNILFYTFVTVCIKRGLLSFCRNISNVNKNLSNYKMIDIDDMEIEDKKCVIDSIFDNMEIRGIFQKVLYELSFEEANVLELKMNEFTYKEIATLLDIPLSTVGFRLRKARKYLKKHLKLYN